MAGMADLVLRVQEARVDVCAGRAGAALQEAVVVRQPPARYRSGPARAGGHAAAAPSQAASAASEWQFCDVLTRLRRPRTTLYLDMHHSNSTGLLQYPGMNKNRQQSPRLIFEPFCCSQWGVSRVCLPPVTFRGCRARQVQQGRRGQCPGRGWWITCSASCCRSGPALQAPVSDAIREKGLETFRSSGYAMHWQPLIALGCLL